MVTESIDDDEPGFDLWTLHDASIDAPDNALFFIWICCLGTRRFHRIKPIESSDSYYLLQDILYDYERRETVHCMLTEDQKHIFYDYEKGETINRELTLDNQNVCATEKYTLTLVSLDGFQQVE